MKNTPIDIRVKDNRNFMMIALLVDRDDFLSDITIIRKQSDIKVVDRETTELRLRTGYQKEDLLKIKEPAKRKELEYLYRYFIQDYGRDLIEPEIYRLLKKYNKSNTFFYVIKSAILTAEIRDMDFNLPEPRVWAASRDQYYHSVQFKFPQIAIIVDPESDIEAINKSLRQFIRAQKPSGMDYGWLIPDTVSNIKRDRDWYWQYKNGKSISDICNDLKGYSQKTIEKAIGRYKRNLTKPLTGFRKYPIPLPLSFYKK